MINALRRFYNSFGDRGVMMVIFTVSVIVHSLLTMHMELPAVNPDEIGVASVAAFYSGRDYKAFCHIEKAYGSSFSTRRCSCFSATPTRFTRRA